MALKGIDLSQWNGAINFKKVKDSGVKFIIIRDGYRAKTDPAFLDYVAGAQKAGYNNADLGVYHFIYTDGATPAQNADSCVANLKKAGLPVATTWVFADLEYDTWTRNGQKATKELCTKYTIEFLQRCEKLGCKKLGVYTNNDYYVRLYDWNKLKKYPIWLADYSGGPDKPCMIQQYSSKGLIAGHSCYFDMNTCFNDADWYGSGKATAPKVEKVTASATLPKISIGASGTAVKVAQLLIGGIAVDGDFGQNTDKAVKAYQEAHKLDVDGVIGQQTWSALLNL